MANEIAYKMVWTSTGLEQVLGKSQTGLEKLSTTTASLISRLEKKAAVADMGADAFALAQAKAAGASAETQQYISALQSVVSHIKTVKDETAAAAAETKRLTGARAQLLDSVKTKMIESKVDNPHDLEKLRLARQLKASGASPDEINGAMHNLDFVRDQRLRKQQQDEDAVRRDRAIERHNSVPDNEELRRQSEYDRTRQIQADERARRQAASDRHNAVPDNEDLRAASELTRKQALARSEREQRDADRAYRQNYAARRGGGVPDNEALRQASESARLAAGEKALAEVTDRLRQSTRSLREEEIASLQAKLNLAGATATQMNAANTAIATHQNDARAMRTLRSITQQDEAPLKRLRFDPNSGNRQAGRGSAIGLEFSRAVEDSIAGGAYGGVKGAIMGASNNISQMGAMMGPQAAIIASITSMTAILGVTAFTAYQKWADGAEAAKKSNEALKASQEDQLQRLRDEVSLRNELRSIDETKGKASAERQLRDKTEAVEDLKAEQDMKRQQVKNMLARVGFTDKNTVQDLQDAAADKNLVWAKPGGEFADAPLDIQHNKITPEYVARAIELQQEANLMNHKVDRAEQARDKAKGVLGRETIADQGAERDEAMKSRKEVKDADADDRAARKAARKQKDERVADMRLSMLNERDSRGNLIDDDGRRQKSAKAELERRERDTQIDKWKKEGLITGSEADSMKNQSKDQRNQEIRRLNDRPDGQKAQALDVRSSEGMSQLLRAINGSKEDIAKQQLDVEKNIEQAIKDGNEIKPIEVTVVNWS